MKKLYTLIAALIVATAINAQINVTFKIDITDYLASGGTLNANGIRIGGNFEDTGGMNGADTLAQWSPSDASCAMTNESGNIWSKTVTFTFGMLTPPFQDTLFYKFVNGDWGTNEGTDAGCEIATSGCGLADAGGNINRLLATTTLAGDITLNFCWDKCNPCSSAGFQLVNNQSDFSLYPNPANNNVNVSFNSFGNSKIEIFNAIGQKVNTQSFGDLNPGNYKQNVSTDNLTQGIYFVKLTTGNKIETKTMSIVK